MRAFVGALVLLVVGAVVAEIGQLTVPYPLPWATGVGVVAMPVAFALAVAQIRRGQLDNDPRERRMWVVLGVALFAIAAFWLYLPAHLNGDEWLSLSTQHDRCASGRYEPGPCTLSAIDLSWGIGLAGLGIGAFIALVGWYITAFQPVDAPTDIE